MKKQLQLCLFLLICFFAFGQEADAQVRKRQAPELEFKDKLWYGGGFNLGFSGSGNTNIFVFGLSPMVGYKVFEQFSVGPRVSVDFSFIRTNIGAGRVAKAQPVSYSVGAFGRYKFLPSIFAHAEYGVEDEGSVVDAFGFLNPIDANGNIEIQRFIRNNAYLGLGYSSGNGGAAYEVVLLYNFLAPDNSIELPIDLRFGFTWKF